MAIAERRFLGVIVHYSPKEGRGVINAADSMEDIPFSCQHVRSDVLREKLAKTNRFHENIFIQPNVYVTYAICSMINEKAAGRIEPVEPISPDLNLSAPIIGYIQHFGSSRTGSDGLSGWINPSPGMDEQGSSWFDLRRVIDPALKAYLRANPNQTKSRWNQQAIEVRYWKTDENRSTPTCTHVALVDDTLRERWIRQYSVSQADLQAWNSLRMKYLSAPDSLAVPAYTELPLVKEPLTVSEQRILNEFRKEAFCITASNPAQRGQMDHLFEKIERRDNEDLEAALLNLPNINGTKLAIICRAACRYLDHEYADSLEMCYNAQRYDFAAELAVQMKKYGIAQRLAELAINEEPTDKRIQLLRNAALHTNNAIAFCDYYQEMIDICGNEETADDEYDLFTGTAIELLDNLRIDSESMDAKELCLSVREHYQKSLPTLSALLLEQRKSEKETACRQDFSIPADRLQMPIYYKLPAAEPAAEAPVRKESPAVNTLLAEFNKRFKGNDGYNLPDPVTDTSSLSIVDAVLHSELPSISDYRMPLLVRLCLDPSSSAPDIQSYLRKLECDMDRRRKRYDGDRRWRLFKALLDYVQAANAKSRAEAWNRAFLEKHGDDELLFLNALPH